MSSVSEAESAAVSATLEQLLTLRQPTDVQLSADGAELAFVTAAAVANADGVVESRIWAGPVEGPVREITRGPGSDRLPRFAPDGGSLVFASDRDHPGWASPFVLAPGAEARPLGEVPGSVEAISWFPDGKRIAVLAADFGSDTSGITRAVEIGPGDEEDPEVRRPAQAWRRLFVVDVESGETTEVGPRGLTVWEFSLHGGRAVAVVSEDPSEGGWYEGWIGTIELATREISRLYSSDLQLECPRLSPDGRRLAWAENICSDRGVLAGTLTVLDLETEQLRRLAEDADVTKFEWVDAGRLRVCGPRGLGAYCGFVDLASGELELAYLGSVRLGGLHQVSVTADAAGSRFAASRDAPGEPPEVAVLDLAELDSGWRQVTALNGHLEALPVPEMREMRWSGDDGLEIEGLLVSPPGAEGPLPLVVTVHGGPTACWEWAFSPGYWHSANLFAEAGYAVLLPNPRGSAGRGREFARANVGDVGGGDLRDILAGVDACVEAGIADSERVGVWGISYGGFITSWMVGKTDRFAAIVPVSCHSNWLSFHNTANIPAFDRLFVGADPYEAGGKYFQLSPVVHAPKATTPTLFLHGALDRICPLSQAEEMYRAIAEAGCETELVIYPREGHGFLIERDHAIDAWNRLRGWMDRHLLGGDV